MSRHRLPSAAAVSVASIWQPEIALGQQRGSTNRFRHSSLLGSDAKFDVSPEANRSQLLWQLRRHLNCWPHYHRADRFTVAHAKAFLNRESRSLDARQTTTKMSQLSCAGRSDDVSWRRARTEVSTLGNTYSKPQPGKVLRRRPAVSRSGKRRVGSSVKPRSSSSSFHQLRQCELLIPFSFHRHEITADWRAFSRLERGAHRERSARRHRRPWHSLSGASGLTVGNGGLDLWQPVTSMPASNLRHCLRHQHSV